MRQRPGYLGLGAQHRRARPYGTTYEGFGKTPHPHPHPHPHPQPQPQPAPYGYGPYGYPGYPDYPIAPVVLPPDNTDITQDSGNDQIAQLASLIKNAKTDSDRQALLTAMQIILGKK